MEEIKDQAYFKELAHRLMFDLSDEEALDIVKEFKTLCSQLELLEAIDTTGVEPMPHPIPVFNVMREDEVKYEQTKSEMMANAPYEEDGFFRVPKIN